MRVVVEHEQAQGRQVYDVSEKNLGYDVTSLDLGSGDLRLIEVKGLGASTGTILLTPNERRVAEDRRDCYWLYVVTNCDATPRLEEPIRDPARLDWNEVTKVAHYYFGRECADEADAGARRRAAVWREFMTAERLRQIRGSPDTTPLPRARPQRSVAGHARKG